MASICIRTLAHSQTRALAARMTLTLVLGIGAAALAGCASDDTAAATNTGPREVQLSLNQGLVLSTGEVLPSASYLKADLILYKNQNGFDLKPGSEAPGQQMAMGVFGNGGVETVFTSLDQVPATKAMASNVTYMSDVGTGFGAVVQHNIGAGWSKIWVKQAIASAGMVVIQWQAID